MRRTAMKMERVFLAEGKIRAIWRFLLSVPTVLLAMLIAQKAGGFVAGGLHQVGWGRVIWPSLFTLAALLAGYKLLTLALDRRPLGSVGLAFCGRWPAELGLGLSVGALMIAAVAGLERLLGLAQFSLNSAPPERFVAWGAGTLGMLFVAATNEELVFRGYPFQRLAESLGAVAAVALFAGLFGLAHLGNPSRTWISTLNTMLVGIPLSIGYLRSRSLWLPVGLHFGWNFLQGFGLGLPVSGIGLPFSALKATVSGNELLTGGSYGPEGGLLTTGVIAAATVYLSLSKRIYISQEMRALVFGPGPSEGTSAAAVASLQIPTAQASVNRPDTK
jgi:membrane protease YdiL (CAAX protease family)